MCLKARDIKVSYGQKEILKSIDFELDCGEVLAVLGGNGAGKTTLFRTVMKFFEPEKGRVFVDGRDISKISRREISKNIAYVPQCHNCTFPYSVLDIVVMGRYSSIGVFSEPSKKDYNLATECMEKLNIAHLAKRKFKKLSGGEKQLVLIARALAQKPKILVMDEPTASLDFKNSIVVLNEILKLREENLAIMITCHSPSQAKVFADKVLMIKDGSVFKNGSAALLEDSDVLRELYGIDIDSVDDLRIKEYINQTA